MLDTGRLPGRMMVAILLAQAFGGQSLWATDAWVAVKGTTDRPPAGRCGHVRHDFDMGRTEVSNADYAAFLNAVARVEDPFQLFTPLMEAHFWGGIVRTRAADGWRYAAKPGQERHPVVFVSWMSAARYANWLGFGRPSPGFSGVGSTEGDGRVGGYDTRGAASASDHWPQRSLTARYALPTCDEWAKAAFFDPARRRWNLYPTAVDALVPGPAAAGRPDGANLMTPDGFANPAPHMVPVDSYAEAASPHGTLNQGGNALEWLEDRDKDHRMFLGGNLFMYPRTASALYRDGEFPDHRLSTLGFRVVRLTMAQPETVPPVRAVTRTDAARLADRFVPVTMPDGRRFDMQAYEIANADYARFLNAVARTDDRHGLYRRDMSVGIVGGIDRGGAAGRWTYAAKPGWERRPVTYLSWFALVRYANWRHFGEPDGGSTGPGITEGDAVRGAYDTRHFPRAAGAPFDPARLPVARNPGARFFIPTSAEWLAAGHYDPAGAGRWFDYPTRSDAPPSVDAPAPAANYQAGDRLAEGAPWFVAEVDAYADSVSPSGTHQQGGNVWEWMEEWRSRGEGGCWRCDEWTRGMRGGSFQYSWRGLRRDNLDPGSPDQAFFVYGGRLARPASDPGR